jgi:hypothetical protein
VAARILAWATLSYFGRSRGGRQQPPRWVPLVRPTEGVRGLGGLATGPAGGFGPLAILSFFLFCFVFFLLI